MHHSTLKCTAWRRPYTSLSTYDPSCEARCGIFHLRCRRGSQNLPSVRTPWVSSSLVRDVQTTYTFYTMEREKKKNLVASEWRIVENGFSSTHLKFTDRIRDENHASRCVYVQRDPMKSLNTGCHLSVHSTQAENSQVTMEASRLWKRRPMRESSLLGRLLRNSSF